MSSPKLTISVRIVVTTKQWASVKIPGKRNLEGVQIYQQIDRHANILNFSSVSRTVLHTL